MPPITLALFAMVLLLPAPALAAPKPAWKLTITSQPTNFVPGTVASEATDRLPQYYLLATNVGGGPTSGPFTVDTTLPAGINPVPGLADGSGPVDCAVAVATVSCTDPAGTAGEAWPNSQPRDPRRRRRWIRRGQRRHRPGHDLRRQRPARFDQLENDDSSSLPSFDFLEGPAGLSATANDEDGAPTTQAGSHPHQLTIDLGFPTIETGLVGGGLQLLGAEGGVRDIITDLPPGLIVNPRATPVLCTEAQLEANPSCPDASAIGTINIHTVVLGLGPRPSPLYNMVPSPGAAATLGFNALGAGIFIHILGGVREGDYALSASSSDILARAGNPLFGAQVQLWGDPSSPSHDRVRGECNFNGDPDAVCPVPAPRRPLPHHAHLLQRDPPLEARADCWEQPRRIPPPQRPAHRLRREPHRRL